MPMFMNRIIRLNLPIIKMVIVKLNTNIILHLTLLSGGSVLLLTRGQVSVAWI